MFAQAPHALQLFDSLEAKSNATFRFMREGVMRGDSVVMIVDAAHQDALQRKSREHRFDLEVARAAGWVVFKDATDLVAGLTYAGRLNWDRFHAEMAAQLGALTAAGGLCIYGEAVDLLVRQNEFALAEELEASWNRLGEEVPFTLFCGYSSEHFGNPRDAASLRRICRLHSHYEAAPTDTLGAYLLKTHCTG